MENKYYMYKLWTSGWTSVPLVEPMNQWTGSLTGSISGPVFRSTLQGPHTTRKLYIYPTLKTPLVPVEIIPSTKGGISIGSKRHGLRSTF